METMNDYELLYLMSEQDEEAQKLLIKLYEQRIERIIRKTVSSGGGKHLRSDEFHDLKSKCMLSLIEAVNQYHDETGVPFSYYASLCITTCVRSYLRKTRSQANYMFATCTSLDLDLSEDEGCYLISLVQNNQAEFDPKWSFELKEAQNNLQVALMSAEGLRDESTVELEASIANIDEINRKVRANMDKDKAEEDAREYRSQYNALTRQIDDTRKAKTDLLQSAELPLPELSVKEGELIYRGQKWDNMSGSDRLKVSTAIVRKLNPKCGFVLLDKLEQMDMQTLNEFGQWLEQEGLQAIATRVSTGDECSIIIEDGYVKGQERPKEDIPQTPAAPSWKAGEF